MLNIIIHQGNANQKYSQIALNIAITRMAEMKKTDLVQSVGKDVEQLELSNAASEMVN